MKPCNPIPLLLLFLTFCCFCNSRPTAPKFPYKKGCRNVELHIHLDGSFRPATLFRLAKSKGIPLKQKTEKELADYMHLKTMKPNKDGSYSLKTFLEPFSISGQIVTGDLVVLDQLSREFVQDMAAQNTCYVEAKIASYFLKGPEYKTGEVVSDEEVIETILRAFREEGQKLGVKVRLLLAAIRTLPEQTSNMTDLALKFRNLGVVGVDLAGDENKTVTDGFTPPSIVAAFKKAYNLGIHRTVHAGETNSSQSVHEAVYNLHAERIGHGYAVVHNLTLYEDLKNKGIHYEVCPKSSKMTGGYRGPLQKHPVKKFAEDGVSFSLSTDDPMITDTTLQDEFQLAEQKIGLRKWHIRQAQINAALASFLLSDEKNELVEALMNTD